MVVLAVKVVVLMMVVGKVKVLEGGEGERGDEGWGRGERRRRNLLGNSGQNLFMKPGKRARMADRRTAHGSRSGGNYGGGTTET